MIGAAYSIPASIFRAYGGVLSDRIGARTVLYWTFAVSAVAPLAESDCAVLDGAVTSTSDISDQVALTTIYPGASPDDIECLITQKIEEEMEFYKAGKSKSAKAGKGRPNESSRARISANWSASRSVGSSSRGSPCSSPDPQATTTSASSSRARSFILPPGSTSVTVPMMRESEGIATWPFA